MIPFAILSCKARFSELQESVEIRILDLSVESFTIRLPKNITIYKKETEITLFYFQYDSGKVETLDLEQFDISIQDEQQYFCEYLVETNDIKFRQYTDKLMKEYMRYINLKIYETDQTLSHEMIGIPLEEWNFLTDSFMQQQKLWLTKSQAKEMDLSKNPFSLAVSLDRPFLRYQYEHSTIEEFSNFYWKNNILVSHMFQNRTIDCLYIGNQFCHHLFPGEDELLRILDKTIIDGIQPVIVFSYMKEEMVESTANILKLLDQWCIRNKKHIEVVINDWGMASLMKEKGWNNFSLTLGILLNKRRKDARMKYKIEKYKDECPKIQRDSKDQKNTEEVTIPKLLEENMLQAEFFQKYLEKTFDVKRASYETCGYEYRIALKGAIHIPYFQMNTSQFCPLAAVIEQGKRGIQKDRMTCPYYCQKKILQYPDNMQMVGRMNSIFGLDERCLSDERYLIQYLKQGIDRIVVEM